MGLTERVSEGHAGTLQALTEEDFYPTKSLSPMLDGTAKQLLVSAQVGQGEKKNTSAKPKGTSSTMAFQAQIEF